MPVTLVEINRDNVVAFMKLDVTPEQEAAGLVACNAASIAQAHYEPGAWLRGLVIEGTPAGLISMVDLEAPGVEKEPGEPDNAAYLWRLMIDAAHQGKGYGRDAIRHAFAHAKALGRGHLLLSVADAPLSALPLYERHGFARTGRIVDGEIELIAAVS